MRLKNQVAIVTGASQGIGEAVALANAAEGARVCLNYLTYAEGAEHVAARIGEWGGQAITVHADVPQANRVERLMRGTREAFGPIDRLVNNAANYPRHAWEEVTEAFWDRMLGVNLRSQYLCAQAVSARMCA